MSASRTYLGADTLLASVAQAATAVEPDAVVLATVFGDVFAAAADEVAQLATAWPVVIGGAGTTQHRVPALAALVLPARVITAAQALTLRPPRYSQTST